MKKTVLSIFLVVIFALLMTSSASANSFSFSYDNVFSGLVVDVDGVLTANPTGNPNEYLITGVTGTRNGAPITFFASGGPSSFGYGDTAIDNLLYVPPGNLSFTSHSGFVFGTIDGEFNPYWASGTSYFEYKLGGGNGNPGIAINFAAQSVPTNAVPEPSTLLLLGFGLVGITGIKKRKIG